MTHTCHYSLCSNNATFRCTRCKQVYYCCREHQKADWVGHKLTCVPPTATASSPSPSRTCRNVDSDSFPPHTLSASPSTLSDVPSLYDSSSTESSSTLLADVSSSNIPNTDHISSSIPSSTYPASTMAQHTRLPLSSVPRAVRDALDAKIVRSVAGYLRAPDNAESNLLIVLPGANDTPMLRESPVFSSVTLPTSSSSSSLSSPAAATHTIPPATGTDEHGYYRALQQMALPQASALFLSPFHVHKPFLSLGITLRQFFPCFSPDGTRIAGKAADIPTRHARVLGLWEGGLALILLLRVLVRYCHWPLSRIFLIGHGDGAVLAVHTATYLSTYLRMVHMPQERLGGVYAHDGCLIGEMQDIWAGNSNIPATLPSPSSSSSSTCSSSSSASSSSAASAAVSKVLPLSLLTASVAIETPIFLATRHETATVTAQLLALKARATAGHSPTVFRRNVYSMGAGGGVEGSEKAGEGDMIALKTYKEGKGIFGSQEQVRDFMEFYAHKGFFRDLGLENNPNLVQLQ